MYVRSKVKRTLRWCWNNGKSWDLNGKPVNMAKLGADINLKAVGCVSEEFIGKYENTKVYFYKHKKEHK